MTRRSHSTLPLIVSSLAFGISVSMAIWLPMQLSSPTGIPHACSHRASEPAPVFVSAPDSGHVTDERSALARELQALIPATSGQPASPGDRVLARWSDGNYWEARVIGAAGDRVRVAWLDGSAPMDLPLTYVAPIPAERYPLTVGDLAMCKWNDSTRWWRARIEARDHGLGVLYIDATRKPLTGQCVAARAGF